MLETKIGEVVMIKLTCCILLGKSTNLKRKHELT